MSPLIAPLVASFGGVLVAVGLWIEKKADEKLRLEHISNFVQETARLKKKAELGWWILMVGIILEVILGFLLALNGEMEMREAVNNESINRPVNDISARAIINIRGFSGSFWQPADDVQVRLFESHKEETLSLGSFGFLNGEFEYQFTHWNPDNPQKEFRTYTISLSQRGYLSEDGFVQSGSVIKDGSLITAGQFMSNIDSAEIILKTFPKNAELVGGGVEVVINRTFKKRFKLLPNQSTEVRPSSRQADFNRVFLTATSNP